MVELNDAIHDASDICARTHVAGNRPERLPREDDDLPVGERTGRPVSASGDPRGGAIFCERTRY